jgi:hypothetical protein
MGATVSDPLLASLVTVRQGGVRSINIENDLRSASVANGYVLTDQARAVLGRILNRMEGDFATRAWTLTGPYGSGKSYFGLYLMNLVSSLLPSHHAAQDQLQALDLPLAEHVQRAAALGRTQGFLAVPVVGRRTSIDACIKNGILSALEPHSHDPKVKQITGAYRANGVPLPQLLDGARKVAADLDYQGIILVLDEMGKLLEHAAAHSDIVDVYTFQEIAEFANRSGDMPFVFIGVLHQSFERYAGRLDSTTQREWSKVQGRYEDIAFQEPPIQQMMLAIRSLQTEPARQLAVVERLIRENATQVQETSWRPPTLSQPEFQALAEASYPFHPTTLVTLPYLFRRLAQNERSMFAYLSSHEPFGFQEFLQQHVVTDTVRLANLFDYLTANFQGRLYATMRARLITETLERLDQAATKLNDLERDVLKTIGLLNWLAEVSPLQATETELIAALQAPNRPPALIREVLEAIRRMSLIVFRRFNSTYTVWQGSDVDLDEQLQQAHRRLSGVYSLAEAVQDYLPPRPLVARRHSYQTGTTRYFELRYVDVGSIEQVGLGVPDGAAGSLFVGLPSSAIDADQLQTWATGPVMSTRSDLVVGLAQHTTRLAELAGELRALHWVKDHTPELRDDPVARRELRARLHVVESLLRNEIERTLKVNQLTDEAGCRWLYRGDDVTREAARGLSYLLSAVCDRLYAGSPRVWNELINRRKLTSQGAAARRNLIEAMLANSNEQLLGIEGFPPERSMYESLLEASGLHRPAGPKGWAFMAPPNDDPLGLVPSWSAIGEFIFAPPPEPRSVQDLFDLLAGPPYGLTEGVMPVLLCAFMLAHQDAVTLYSEGTLLPEPAVADWEVLLRRPELFSVAGSRVVGPRADVVDRLARGLGTAPDALTVIRDLIRRLKTLPDHVWRTNRLSDRTLAVRQAVDVARSPETLLFHDLPVALELDPFAESHEDERATDEFFGRLNTALQELDNRMSRTLAEARSELLVACGQSPDDPGWRQFLVEAAELSPRVNKPQLTPFLRRAVEGEDDEAALESVLAYVASRPPRTWSDADVSRFRQQMVVMGELYLRERAVWLPYATLTPDQRVRSQAVAARLRDFLETNFSEDPAIIDAALHNVQRENRRAHQDQPDKELRS